MADKTSQIVTCDIRWQRSSLSFIVNYPDTGLFASSLSGTFSPQGDAVCILGFDIFVQEVIYKIIHPTPFWVDSRGVSGMRRFHLGDRVWVKIPEKPVERKVATIVGVKTSGNDTLYRLEWEIDLSETRDRQPEYSAQEIARAGG